MAADIYWCFRSSCECPQRSGVQQAQCCGLRAQSLSQRKQAQGLRSKTGTKTSSGSPKGTSFRGGRDQAKDQNLQVLWCCIFIFPGFFFWIYSANNAVFSFCHRCVLLCSVPRSLFALESCKNVRFPRPCCQNRGCSNQTSTKALQNAEWAS